MNFQPEGSDEYERSLLRSIIQTAPDAIVTAGADGLILSFSPAAERMFGYSEAEVTGQNVAILMPEPYRSGHDTYMHTYLTTGEKRIIGIGREVRARRRNGEIFNAELAVGEIAASEQRVFTGFIRDITDRIEAQRRAARLQRTLERMDRSHVLGEMSQALAHELNQPLTAATNFARAARRVLQSPGGDRDKALGYLDRTAQQTQRAGQIMRRMQQLVERGRTEPRPDDLNAIVQEAIRSYLGPEEMHPAIVLDLADDLPQVLADRIQIQQVIINLVRNAQEASASADGGDVHVETGVWQGPPVRLRAWPANAEEVMITISDTGPGVPADLSETLFEPFVSGGDRGLGVGLAISRSIVAAHGGRIWTENSPGGGAEFHFTLPVATARP